MEFFACFREENRGRPSKTTAQPATAPAACPAGMPSSAEIMYGTTDSFLTSKRLSRAGLAHSPYLDKLPTRRTRGLGESQKLRSRKRKPPRRQPQSLPPLGNTPEPAAAAAPAGISPHTSTSSPPQHSKQVTIKGIEAPLLREIQDLKQQLQAAQAAGAASEARAAAAEARVVVQTGQISRSAVRHWRLATALAKGDQPQGSPRPVPPPPPADSDTTTPAPDPHAGLRGWLAGAGTAVLCSLAAKAMGNMLHLAGQPPPSSLEAATQAAAAACAREPEERPLEVLKAALVSLNGQKGRGCRAVTGHGGGELMGGRDWTQDGAAEQLAQGSGLQRGSSLSTMSTIRNEAARAWWAHYIGEKTAVRAQLMIGERETAGPLPAATARPA